MSGGGVYQGLIKGGACMGEFSALKDVHVSCLSRRGCIVR